jgi:hypothetical protein
MPALSKAIVSLAAAGIPAPGRFAREIPRWLLEHGIPVSQTTNHRPALSTNSVVKSCSESMVSAARPSASPSGG